MQNMYKYHTTKYVNKETHLYNMFLKIGSQNLEPSRTYPMKKFCELNPLNLNFKKCFFFIFW